MLGGDFRRIEAQQQMKWFFALKDRLQNRNKQQPPLVIRTVPADERPARAPVQVTPEQDSQAGIEVETNFGFSDSLTLSNPDDPKGNPYETHSWELDPSQDTRQLKKVDMIDRPRGKKSANNPYDTGEFRKGWGDK